MTMKMQQCNMHRRRLKPIYSSFFQVINQQRISLQQSINGFSLGDFEIFLGRTTSNTATTVIGRLFRRLFPHEHFPP